MNATGRIGFMQGRLCERVDGRIQAFPWDDWRSEFPAAESLGLTLMEWTLDHARMAENPLLTPTGRAEIDDLSRRHGVRVRSVTGDNFMQAPFWKALGHDRSRLLVEFEELIEACGLAGIDFIVVPFVDAGRIDNADEEDIVVQTLISLIDKLERTSVRIIFESDYPPLELRRFVARLPAAHFGVNYDIGNSAALGYDSLAETTAYGERILNVHVKDRRLGGTTVPLGLGAADLPRSFRALARSGYAGNFILQTARAEDGDHVGVLRRYRDMTVTWLEEAGPWTSN